MFKAGKIFTIVSLIHCFRRSDFSLVLVADERAELHTCGARCAHVKVRVDVRSYAHRTVSHIRLDYLHILTECYEERSTGVSQVVEADFPQSVLFEEGIEVLGYEVRAQEHSELVDAYHIEIFL